MGSTKQYRDDKEDDDVDGEDCEEVEEEEEYNLNEEEEYNGDDDDADDEEFRMNDWLFFLNAKRALIMCHNWQQFCVHIWLITLNED